MLLLVFSAIWRTLEEPSMLSWKPEGGKHGGGSHLCGVLGIDHEGSRLLAEVNRKGWVLGDRCRERGASHLILACSPPEPCPGAGLRGFIARGTVGLNISLVYFSSPSLPSFSLSLPSPFPPFSGAFPPPTPPSKVCLSWCLFTITPLPTTRLQASGRDTCQSLTSILLMGGRPKAHTGPCGNAGFLGEPNLELLLHALHKALELPVELSHFGVHMTTSQINFHT